VVWDLVTTTGMLTVCVLLGVVLAHEPLFVCLLWTNKTIELVHACVYAGR